MVMLFVYVILYFGLPDPTSSSHMGVGPPHCGPHVEPDPMWVNEWDRINQSVSQQVQIA